MRAGATMVDAVISGTYYAPLQAAVIPQATVSLIPNIAQLIDGHASSVGFNRLTVDPASWFSTELQAL